MTVLLKHSFILDNYDRVKPALLRGNLFLVQHLQLLLCTLPAITVVAGVWVNVLHVVVVSVFARGNLRSVDGFLL